MSPAAYDVALWLLVLLPAVSGGALALGGTRARLSAPVAVGVAALEVALAVLVALARPGVSAPFVAGAPFGLAVGGLAALVVPTLAGVTLLVLVFAAGDLVESRGRFHGLMLVFAAAAMLTATATTLPALLLAWEVMGATSYALIGFWWREPDRVSAGLTAFVTTRTADLGLYVAAGAALAGGAGLGLAELPEASSGWRHVAAAGIVVAAAGKAAQLPFSFWLSRAMAGPSPVSALLHSAAMVAMGGYLLLRVSPLLEATGWAGPLVAWVGAATAILLGGVALAQTDLKQLLAASTSAQLGFVVLAAGVASVGAGTTHLVGHAATKALLFLAAGAWLSLTGTERLDELAGAARRWPVVGWSATVGLLALAGVVPLSLWATKDVVLAGALEQSVWLYLAGLAGSALSAAYATKALALLWRRPARGAADRAGRPPGVTAGALRQAPLVVLALGAALLGALAFPPLAGRVAGAVGGGDEPQSTALELAGSALLALLVVVGVWRALRPAPGTAPAPAPQAGPGVAVWRGWLGLGWATDLLAVRPTLGLARALARFDDRVVDGAVEATARATRRSALALGGADRASLDGLVEALAGGVRRLGTLARMPQTGQLHHYYLQAVVGLAALALGTVVALAVR